MCGLDRPIAVAQFWLGEMFLVRCLGQMLTGLQKMPFGSSGKTVIQEKIGQVPFLKLQEALHPPYIHLHSHSRSESYVCTLSPSKSPSHHRHSSAGRSTAAYHQRHAQGSKVCPTHLENARGSRCCWVTSSRYTLWTEVVAYTGASLEHRIIESLRLEKTFKVIWSNHHLTTNVTH